MPNMGILRRIDELGRIVIPKGIRTRLKINEGDTLELVVTDDNVINISRFNSFKGNFETISSLLESLGKEMNLELALCSGQEFLLEYPSKENTLVHKSVNNVLMKAINERKVTTLLSQSVFEDIKEVSYFVVFPLAKNSESLGALIVLNRQSLNEEESRIVGLFRNFIVNLL